jgi:peptide/nickel transport system permease protein
MRRKPYSSRTSPVELQEAQRTYARVVMRRLLRDRRAAIGAFAVLALLVPSLMASHVSRYDPLQASFDEALQAPDTQHPLGTDELGRDVLSRILHGGRTSLAVGFIAVGVALLLGMSLGLIAGYSGGWLAAVIMRAVDVLLAFPGVLLALVVIALMGPGLQNVMIAIGIAYAPHWARVMRGSVISAKENTYVLAAEAIGCSHVRIAMRHILPNVMGPMVVLATLGVGGAIIDGAALSFLGMGARPPHPEWGSMLSVGKDYMRLAWWMSVFPGLAIAVTVLGANWLGDAMRDALDPRLRV